jgi:ISXO2-like transposase domain
VRPLTVVSDRLSCFMVTADAGVHESIVVSAGNARFNAVSIAQSNLKAAISGAYHSIKFARYAHRCFAEFQYRFNRRFDLRAIFARLACEASRSSPQNRLLIRVAEIGC